MDEIIPFETGRRFWQKVAHGAGETSVGKSGAGEGGIEPLDPMVLAAYAEGRLDPAAAEAVEIHLLTDSEALETLAAIASPGHRAIDADRLIARATALVPNVPSRPADRIVPLPARTSGLRAYAAWGAMAASLLVVSLVGFNVGRSAEHALDPARYQAATDLPDPTLTLFPNDVLG
ncbi:MAG TPA: hypothetical protein VNT30_14800 [Stellaceae bacterium]|nr:hypothetical protein [Stellaceae bacterium]